MASLHGILAELGIENPVMHPEREASHVSDWVLDLQFHPQTGHSYELAFGKVLFNGEHQPVVRRVRIDGPTPDQWFDLDEQAPLDRELQLSPVRAFREIG